MNAPWEFLRIRRAISTLDASLIHLYPKANYTKLTSEYFEKMQRRTLKKVLSEPAAPLRSALLSVSELPDLRNRLQEFTLFQSELIRRRVRVFDGATTKVSELLARTSALLSWGLLIGWIFAVAAFLRYHYPDSVVRLLSDDLDMVLDVYPQLTPRLWAVWLSVHAYVWFVTRRLRARFARTEVTPPGTSTQV